MVTKSSVANFVLVFISVCLCIPDLLAKGENEGIFSLNEWRSFISWVPQVRSAPQNVVVRGTCPRLIDHAADPPLPPPRAFLSPRR